MARGRKEHRDRERRHHRQIEQNGRCRRRREACQRIQNAAVKRDQRHQQEIGKGDARELDRQGEAFRILGKSRRQQGDHRRRENQRDDEQDNLACKKQGEHAIGEKLGGVGAALLADTRVGGHEGGVEGTLGEDRTKMVRQSQRDEKRIRDRSGPEHSGQDDVARKAGKPRYQRQAADGEDASNHWPRPLS